MNDVKNTTKMNEQELEQVSGGRYNPMYHHFPKMKPATTKPTENKDSLQKPLG